MKLIAALFLVALPAFSQAYRFDPSPVTTTNASCQQGQLCQLLAIPGSQIQLCNSYPACNGNGISYTDQTMTQACPPYAAVTLPGSALCQQTAGPQGQFGFWVAPGQNIGFKVTTPQGSTYGPFPFTAPASASQSGLPVAVSSSYIFTQSPGGIVSSGSNTVTLSPCPAGVNGADTSHYLYLTGGGTPEAVLITGGSCVSGAAIGTVRFTAANSHSGAWVIQSATGGIQEAIWSVAGTSGANIFVPAGSWQIYAPITFYAGNGLANTAISLYGGGMGSQLHRAFSSGNLLVVGNTAMSAGAEYNVRDLFILTDDNFVTSDGAAVSIQPNAAFITIQNVEVWNGFDGFVINQSNCKLDHVKFFQQAQSVSNHAPSRYGLYLTSSTGAGPSSVFITTSDFTTQNPLDSTYSLKAGIQIEASDGVQIINSDANGLSGVVLQTNGVSDLNDVYMDNLVIDTVANFGVFMGGGTPAGTFAGNIRLSNSHIFAYQNAVGTSQNAVEIDGGSGTIQGVQIVNNNMGGFQIYGVRVGGGTRDVTVSGNMIMNNAGAGISLIGGSIRPVITGNTISNFLNTTPTTPLGIIVGQTLSAPVISGNDVSNVAQAFSVITPGFVTGAIVANNAGWPVATTASAATLVIPLSQDFIITGTTGVTAVNCPFSPGSGSFLSTGTVVFTEGNNIANGGTVVANALYQYLWDGSFLHISGSGF